MMQRCRSRSVMAGVFADHEYRQRVMLADVASQVTQRRVAVAYLDRWTAVLTATIAIWGVPETASSNLAPDLVCSRDWRFKLGEARCEGRGVLGDGKV